MLTRSPSLATSSRRTAPQLRSVKSRCRRTSMPSPPKLWWVPRGLGLVVTSPSRTSHHGEHVADASFPAWSRPPREVSETLQDHSQRRSRRERGQPLDRDSVFRELGAHTDPPSTRRKSCDTMNGSYWYNTSMSLRHRGTTLQMSPSRSHHRGSPDVRKEGPPIIARPGGGSLREAVDLVCRPSSGPGQARVSGRTARWRHGGRSCWTGEPPRRQPVMPCTGRRDE